MTLDEAIEHADWAAETAKWGPLEDECRQYAEWLHELRQLRMGQLRAENERLRDLVRDLQKIHDVLCDDNVCRSCPASEVCYTLDDGRYRMAGIEAES